MSKTTETVVKMLESLPENAQERIVSGRKLASLLPPARRARRSLRERQAKWITANCEIPNAAELLGSLSSPARGA
ncbi:MAG: hypothetical protein HY695_04480 [Deltaproteobacteria bacterium]|nr:hypothetical protein [Deltaproteobacteria bacterium]